MISSMTGYGKSIVQEGDVIVEAEIKSLNSRYLDLSIKLPKNLYHKEFELREKLKNKVKRGKVYLSVNMKKEGVSDKYASIDKEGINAAVEILNEIKKVAKVDGPITIDHLLGFQHLYFTENSNDSDTEYQLVEAVLLAVDDLEGMRKKEGAELAIDLKKRIDIINNALVKIEANTNGSVGIYFEKLKERAKQLYADIADNQDRLNMELALLAERYDVTEECVRLRSHIKMFLDTIENGDEAGRKLNFISQEMNREANTINSKSISTEISHQGISIKEELEKIREQIQNIE